jgi:hypothetical protein
MARDPRKRPPVDPDSSRFLANFAASPGVESHVVSKFTLVRPVLVWLTAWLLLASACSSGEPARLLEEGGVAYDQEQYETAYRTLTEIWRRYPDSRQSGEAFTLAARSFRHLWSRNYYDHPDGPWIQTEPLVMYDWLASFFEDDVAPQEKIDVLFLGMPARYYDKFPEYAKSHPILGAWSFDTAIDDWKIERVAAVKGVPPAQKAADAR